MDILLDGDGDIVVESNGDILIADSVAQKIKIKLGWHEGEWRWEKEEGIPYLEYVFIKNPDLDQIEQLIREKIFEVDEVTEVKDVTVTLDVKKRITKVSFTALTDEEVIKEELNILCQTMV